MRWLAGQLMTDGDGSCTPTVTEVDKAMCERIKKKGGFSLYDLWLECTEDAPLRPRSHSLRAIRVSLMPCRERLQPGCGLCH